MLIIPAIDIIDSKIVRLSKGNYDKITNYSVSPVEQAGIFCKNGFNHIHIIDLIGSKEGTTGVLDITRQIKKMYKVTIQMGGGIRNYENVQNAFDAGVDKVIVGSLSVTGKNEFERIAASFSSKIIVAADALNNEIMITGWTQSTGIKIGTHIEYCMSLGLNEFLCTDIGKDGLLKGPSFEMYSMLSAKYPSANVIASGGISCMDDIAELKSMNLYATVVGKAIYENKISLKELKEIAD